MRILTLALLLTLFTVLTGCSQVGGGPPAQKAPADEPPKLQLLGEGATTVGCGGEGERPCGADTTFFWDNGNLFADRGLKATGFKILPDVSFNGSDWIDLNRADVTKLKQLIEVDLPALETQLYNLTEDDFLSDVCLGTVQDDQCWATPPFDGPGYTVFGDCVPVIPGVGSDCTVHYPGIPSAEVPLPDFEKSGWEVPDDVSAIIADLGQVAASLPDVIQGVPAPPSVGFGGYSDNPDIFDVGSFLTDLAAFKSFFTDNPFIAFFEDLYKDFFDPPGVVVNATRHQQAAEDFQQTWAYWAFANQRELANREPLNWTQYLNAHNAFNNAADGYIAPNQRYSLTDQLNLGARGLSLDIHWFNGQLRLCHGKADHSGCALTDRYYSNAIKELGNWLRAHPSEVIVIGFEDRSEGHDAYVNDPIAAYLVDEHGRSLVYSPADAFPGGQRPEEAKLETWSWPSLEQLRDAGKRVLIFGDDAHGGSWILPKAANPFSTSRIKSFHYTPAAYDGTGAPPAYTGGDYGCWSYVDSGTVFDFSRIGEQNKAGFFGDVYEARSLLDAFDPTGLIGEELIARLATCPITAIGLDFVQSKEDTSPGNCGSAPECRTEDRRIAAAVWSWRQNDRGDHGDAALFLGHGGRWASRNPAEEHHFACSLPREGSPAGWPDRAGANWKITEGAGAWKEGGRQCLEEFGDDGYVFGVPLIGWQNERLQLANNHHYDLWLNYNDVRQEGAWMVNRRPSAVPGADRLTEEGATVPFDGSGSRDPEGDPLTYTWDFGDGTGAAGPKPAHVFADDGTFPVTLTVDDGYGGIDRATMFVTVANVAPSVNAGDDLVVSEGGRVTLEPSTFRDPGFDCPAYCAVATEETFAASIDWGEGTVDVGTLERTPGRPGLPTTGSVMGSHAYGDDGEYEVEICVMDDDSGVGCDIFTVRVRNADPEIAIDDSTAVRWPGGDLAFLGRRGVAQEFRADARDPGSDDLTIAWSFPPSGRGAITTHYNDGAAPDPASSPNGRFPYRVADPNTSTFSRPGVYTAVADVEDDDGGTDGDSLPLLVTDSRGCTRVFAYWAQQFGARGKQEIDDGRLQDYLAIIRFASAFFDQGNLAGPADAAAILSPKGKAPRGRLGQNALTAWLNFASGGAGWDETVPHVGRPLGLVLKDIDAILLDASASDRDDRNATRAAQFINTIRPGHATCNDPGTP